MKVFIGMINIASIIGELTKAFNEMGVETYTVAYHSTDKLIENNVELVIEQEIEKELKRFNKIPSLKLRRVLKGTYRRIYYPLLVKRMFNKALKECDVFIIIWSSFDKYYKDFKKIKKKGKKLIVVFVGDDVRWYPAMEQEFRYYGMDPMEYENKYFHGLESRLRYLRMSEKYADFIFSRLDQGQLQLRPYYRWNMMVFPEKYDENSNQSQIPLVLHAPSNAIVKGTKYILNAVEELKLEGVKFEFKLIQNIPHTEAIKMYEQADVVIDQLLCPGTGKLATEAMACGKVVMSKMAYRKYPQKNPAACPVIDIDKKDIQQKLKEIIADYDLRVLKAKEARKYVENELDVRIFCKKVIDLVNGKTIEYDYIPEFFKDNFIPESVQSLKRYNRWNKFVSNCDWYKQYIGKKERKGLKF